MPEETKRSPSITDIDGVQQNIQEAQEDLSPFVISQSSLPILLESEI